MQNQLPQSIVSDIKISKLDKSKVEITGSINSEVFATFRKHALKNIGETLTIDGFRKGKVPENILITKVGALAILEEMAEIALSKAYPEIIINNKIDAIGRPEISILKLAEGNPLEFKIVSTVTPEIKLGDYKTLTKGIKLQTKETFEVTDKEIDEALEKIKASHSDHAGHDHDSPEAREQLKKYLYEDKKIQARDKKRIAISDILLDSTVFEIPELLVNSEARRIEAQFMDDISRMGIKLEDYLSHAKKTIEEIRTEWKPNAEKKARLQLILNKISEIENIKVPASEIEEEVKHILDHYKDANREHAYTYAETILTNEKVFQLLEN